ncbi:hypothetical protein J3F84DRAFT_383285 [Trichoderma pleuroticola]
MGCLGRGSRYMCRPVMGLGGCETLPSWSQTASPLTGRPVNTTCNLAAERQKQRSACMAGVGCSHQSEMRLALLGMRSPKGLQSAIPCQPYTMNQFYFFGVRLARSQGRYCPVLAQMGGTMATPQLEPTAMLYPVLYGGLGSIRHGVTSDDKGSHACMILNNLELPSKRNLKIPRASSSTRSRRYASIRLISMSLPLRWQLRRLTRAVRSPGCPVHLDVNHVLEVLPQTASSYEVRAYSLDLGTSCHRVSLVGCWPWPKQ